MTNTKPLIFSIILLSFTLSACSPSELPFTVKVNENSENEDISNDNPEDVNPTDTGSTDTVSSDTDYTDTDSTDTGSTDTGSTDTGSTDTGSTDTASTDTGSTDTGSTGSGSTNSGSTDTGTTDTGSTDTKSKVATLVSPLPNSTINSSTISISPSATLLKTWLDVGTTKGGEDLHNALINGDTEIKNIPLNGNYIYITLWSEKNGEWSKLEYRLSTKNVVDNSEPDNTEIPSSNNQPPLAFTMSFVVLANDIFTGKLSASDIENDSLLFELVSQPNSGSIDLDINGGFTYQASNNAKNNSDTFSYRVYDGEQYSDTATATLRYSNHPGRTLQGRSDGIGADLVIVAEGFTQEEMSKFDAAVSEYIDFMFKYEPEFKNHKNAWNIHQLNLVSSESGADNSNGANQVNTALDSYFNCGNIDRLLCVDAGKTFSVVNQAFPQWDNILVIVNSSKYGGAGYSSGIGTVSLSGSAKDVGIHEMAHSFAGLADEYSYGGSNAPTKEPGAPNITINNNIDNVKWHHWIDTESTNSIVGLFEGGQYLEHGVWRPTQSSFMRTLGAPFHPINKEAWTLAVYQHGGVYHSKLPASQDVDQNISQNTLFKVDTVFNIGSQSLRWYINNIEIKDLQDQHSVSIGNTQTDDYIVRVEISDKTGSIRKDTNQYSSDSISWNINVE